MEPLGGLRRRRRFARLARSCIRSRENHNLPPWRQTCLPAAMNLADPQILTTGDERRVPPALPPALRALAAEGASGRWSKSLRRLSAHLEEGQSWEAALAADDVRL